ncbi:unnamed protein product [Eretmochelys imbricata]
MTRKAEHKTQRGSGEGRKNLLYIFHQENIKKSERLGKGLTQTSTQGKNKQNQSGSQNRGESSSHQCTAVQDTLTVGRMGSPKSISRLTPKQNHVSRFHSLSPRAASEGSPRKPQLFGKLFEPG